jgi:hypothetical protein
MLNAFVIYLVKKVQNRGQYVKFAKLWIWSREAPEAKTFVGEIRAKYENIAARESGNIFLNRALGESTISVENSSIN